MPPDQAQRRADLKTLLGVKMAMRKARDTFRMDDREPVLVDMMYRVSDLPKSQRRAGAEAALFAIAMGNPRGRAVEMAASYLEGDIERPRSNVARLLRALEVGGATNDSPLQDRVVARTADLYRRVARRDPEIAEDIINAERQGLGIQSSRTFSAKLRNMLLRDGAEPVRRLFG